MHYRNVYRAAALLGCLSIRAATGQDTPVAAPTGERVAESSSAPSERQPIIVKVIKVSGDVQHALPGSNEWVPCKLDDEYPEQTRVRTGVRSSIQFQFGTEEPYSTLVQDSVGLIVIEQAFKTRDTKAVRVGVGYGKVRGGVAEGGLKSDFVVDSPVATLSKRGTEGFSLYYERGTGRFEIGLLDRGLVESLNQITGQRRSVRPGELVTEAMRRWSDQAQLQRNIPVSDVMGHGDETKAYDRMDSEGLGVISPGMGRAVAFNLGNGYAGRNLASTPRSRFRARLAELRERFPDVFVRPEGFFGVGRGGELISILRPR
jgi:hypothetical protein